jgi:hypothetical protein
MYYFDIQYFLKTKFRDPDMALIIPPIVLKEAYKLFTNKNPLWGKIREETYVFSSTRKNYNLERDVGEAYKLCFRSPEMWNSWEEYKEGRFNVIINFLKIKKI